VLGQSKPRRVVIQAPRAGMQQVISRLMGKTSRQLIDDPEKFGGRAN